MSLHIIDPLTDSRWSDFVQQHPQATIFHSRQWMLALQQTYGYKPRIATTSLPGDDITNGVALCRIDSRLTGTRLVSLPFADHCDPLVTDNSEYEALTDSLQQFRVEEQCRYVELRPRSSSFNQASGFGIYTRYWLHTLDLDRDERDIVRHFHPSCIQRRMRHAERMNLKYEESRSESALAAFYRLHMCTRARHNVPPQPIKWFKNLLNLLGDGMTIHTVSKDGRPLASIITLRWGRTLTYKYGASDASSHHLGAVVLLLWRTIQSAKANGVIQLDLGRTDLESGSLADFKDHWGALRSAMSYLRSPQQRQAGHGDVSMRLGKRILAHSPLPIARAVGALLYKHIG